MKETSEEKNLEVCPRSVVKLEHHLQQQGPPAAVQGAPYDDGGGDLFRALEKKRGQSDLRIVRNDQGYALWQERPDGPIYKIRSIIEKYKVLFEVFEARPENSDEIRSKYVNRYNH